MQEGNVILVGARALLWWLVCAGVHCGAAA